MTRYLSCVSFELGPYAYLPCEGELQNDVGYGIPLLRSRGKNRGRGEANYGIPANMCI